jgi:hypothetical protein
LKEILQQAMQLSSWKQQFLFRILSPQSQLVDKNHAAVIDAAELAQIFRQVAELFKPANDRNLAGGLLQGLKKLPSLTMDATQQTLDRYLEPVEGSSNQGSFEVKSGKDDDDVEEENDCVEQDELEDLEDEDEHMEGGTNAWYGR